MHNRGMVTLIVIGVGLLLIYIVIGGFRADSTFIVRDLEGIAVINNTEKTAEIGCGITLLSPIANQVITSPIHVRGYVNGCGWDVSDGRAGYVYVADAKGRAIAAPQVLRVPNKGSKLPAYFEAQVLFAAYPNIEKGTLVFKSEELGEPEYAAQLPVRFKE